MNEHCWQDRSVPLVYPKQHPPIHNHHDPRTAMVGTRPTLVTEICAGQFEASYHNSVNSSSCNSLYGRGGHCGSGSYNYVEGCSNSEYYNHAVYNGSSGTTNPCNPCNISQVKTENFPDDPYNYDLRLVKQEPIEFQPTIREPIFNGSNPYNSNIGPAVASGVEIDQYSHFNIPRPIENHWIKSELSCDQTNTWPQKKNQDFSTGRQKYDTKDAETSNFSSLRRVNPEMRKITNGRHIRDSRAGSLDLAHDRSPSRGTSYCNRRRSLRSPRVSNHSVSPKSSRGLVSTRKKISTERSPVSQRSKIVSHVTQSSRHTTKSSLKHGNTERERLVEWRNKGQKTDPKEKVDLTAEIEKEKRVWTRSAPADLFYTPAQNFSTDLKIVNGTEELVAQCSSFEENLLKKAEMVRADLPKYEPLQRKKKIPIKKHTDCHSSSSSCSSSESDGDEDCTKEELEHKKRHPLRLHQELWFNDPGEMNDGPLCRCSAKARRSGIRHNIYAGEHHLPPCDPNSNNADRLHHYRITISPATNFLVSTPTIIEHDNHEYIFEGFSMFSHKKLDELPLCKVIRFNIEYTIVYYEESFPQNFTVRELNLFYTYLFREILELVDLDLRAAGDSEGCPRYHFMPRFVRELPGNGKEILSMNEVLKYLLNCAKPLIPKEDLTKILSMPQYDWQRFTEDVKGMIVTYPGKKPCSLRVDQLDRDQEKSDEPQFPEIVHFGIRPPQLSYAGNPEYQKAWREYVKFRHLLANMPKPSFDDKRKLESKENKLQSMRTKNELRRNVTVTVSSENFHKTGIMCDVVQHGMLIPVLVSHLRFHRSLDVLEEKIQYKFSNRYLLQLALTHPSYRENFGTNPDHARNSLTNCGIRQPVYGDRKIHYQNTRKRGINTLINIMSRFGKKKETESQITHNERLEFLGDAVVEFVTSVHLFHMFSDLEEGGLATYRAAIVQNQHLAVLAKTLRLEEFMLYAHGSDLCHDLELRHAMANCFEALMGALFLDGGIEVADKVFGEALFNDDPALLEVWVKYPKHPLQEQEPLGDRKWISTFSWLQHLTQFEKSIGVQFTHIRLLARAFTDRSMGYTNLTLGSNQRLEFLGDTVLQLIASEYLYKHFPEHHEGHLSLLRSSLVNNRTQAVVCNDLDMTRFAKYSNPKAELKTKDRADLLEAFLGALYVDKDLEYCQTFCDVCFFPRLQDFIMNQDWNDPKSKLQQCCLTLRTMEGGEPEIPVYKVIECMGPTNTRIYTVAVYFKNRRLAKASGHSIQQAEMNAAKKALKNSQGLFPQLDHQRRVISKSMNRQKRGGPYKGSSPSSKKGDLPNNNCGKKDKGKSRSPSPTKKTNAKGADDVFSQKIRCRTPPLAYQRRNKSPSPKLKSKKKKKCKNKEVKSKDEPEADTSSIKEPLVKKPRRSRSNSPFSKESEFEKKNSKRKSKSLSERKGSRSRSRSRSNEKQSKKSSICCDKVKLEDVKISSNSTTSMENISSNSTEPLGKELTANNGAVVPSSSNTTTTNKEPSCNKTESQSKIPHSVSGNTIKTTRSGDTARGVESAKSSQFQNNRSELEKRSLEMLDRGSENSIPSYPTIGNTAKRNRSRSRNRSSEMSLKKAENMRPTEPEGRQQRVDLTKIGGTRSSESRNKPCDQGNRIENSRFSNPGSVNTKGNSSQIERSWSRLKNNSHEHNSPKKSLSERVNDLKESRGDNNVVADREPKTTHRKSRSLSRSREENISRLFDNHQTPKRRSRSTSKEKECRNNRPRSPLHFRNSQKPVGHPRGVPQSNQSSSRSQSDLRVTSVNKTVSSTERSPIQRSTSSSIPAKSPLQRARSPHQRARSPQQRAKSPQQSARTPLTQARSQDRRSRTSPIRQATSPRRSRSPSVRTMISVRRSRSPPLRAKFPARRSRSPPIRARSPQIRARSPSKRARSPSIRARSPPMRAKSPPGRVRSPSIRARSPPIRARSPPIRARSPSIRARSPPIRARSPPIRARSPPIRGRSPPVRARSPPIRARSPPIRARIPPIRARSPNRRGRSPVIRAKSPQSFNYRRSPSRSPPRGRSHSRSPQENIRQKMMDFIMGKRSSPGLETKGQKNSKWLVDMMYQSTSQTPQPHSLGSGLSQTLHNHQPSNLVYTNSTQVYNQNVSCNEWATKPYENYQEGGSSLNSHSYNNGASYPQPPYHY